MQALSLESLKSEARLFCDVVSRTPVADLYGTTDGKAVGTYVEHRFRDHLSERYIFQQGSSASGVDFPDLQVDLKVTTIHKPQSSSPYRDASQKVYGLGYSILLMVYEKTDDPALQSALIRFRHVVFVSSERTADYQTTYGILGILQRNGNVDDIVAFLEERNLPLDEIGREALANRILNEPPELGYLTISNALQWRLQYRRVIDVAAKVDGLEALLG
jgi:hypothetical protein